MLPRYEHPRQPASFSLFERMSGGIAFLLVVIGLIGFFRGRNVSYAEQPVQSGTYVEGVIADSPTKVERIIARLTNIGLTYRDAQGGIQPALAESWEISSDNKTYIFRLREGISASSLVATIQSSKNNWNGITISAPDARSVQFVLQEPLSLFLSTTTSPLFPYGPFQVVKRGNEETILRAKDDFVLGKPHLSKIIVKTFENQEALLKAANNDEVHGSADFSSIPDSTFNEHTADLPRYHILFLNMAKPVFKKIEDRQRILNKADGNPLTLSLLTSQGGDASGLADSLAQQLSSKKVTLNVSKKNGTTLQKDDLPKREYDLLLYGINYGVDRDYYPFWHSSQASATGLNLANVKDKDLDKILETARKEPDPIKRRELNTQIETYINDRAYQQILKQESFVFWVAKSIKGVEYGTIDEANDRFNLIWKWHIKTKKVPTKNS